MGLEFVVFYLASLLLVQHEFEARIAEASKRPPCIVQSLPAQEYVKPYEIVPTKKKGVPSRECVQWKLKKK